MVLRLVILEHTHTDTFIVETAGSGSRLFTHVFNLISICSTRESKTNSKREARDSKLLISIYIDVISTHVTFNKSGSKKLQSCRHWVSIGSFVLYY